MLVSAKGGVGVHAYIYVCLQVGHVEFRRAQTNPSREEDCQWGAAVFCSPEAPTSGPYGEGEDKREIHRTGREIDLGPGTVTGATTCCLDISRVEALLQDDITVSSAQLLAK